MDQRAFDHLVRSLTVAGSRRGLLGLLAGVPVLGGVVALLPEPVGAARSCADKCDNKQSKRARLRCRRRCRRQKQQKPKSKPKQKQKQKQKRTCRSDEDCPPGTVCANGRCLLGAVEECSVDADCPAGHRCQDRKCGVACGDEFCFTTFEFCNQDQGVCEGCAVICPQRTCDGAQLQNAINQGGTVYVCPGRYTGLYHVNTDVTVIGTGDGDNPKFDTILDGQGSGTVMTISSGVTANFHYLRVQGGKSSNGGGIHADGDVTLDLSHCTITDNDGESGGGLAHRQGTLTITGGTITDNHAGFGGGINNDDGTLIITDCTITDNHAAFEGGGIFHDEGTLIITDCTIKGNQTSSSGGGIYSDGDTVTVTDCTITDNHAQSSVGGIFNSKGILNISGGTITGNSSAEGVGHPHSTLCHGVYNDAFGHTTISGGTIKDNTPGPHVPAMDFLNRGTVTMTGGTVFVFLNQNTLAFTGGTIVACFDEEDGCGCPGPHGHPCP